MEHVYIIVTKKTLIMYNALWYMTEFEAEKGIQESPDKDNLMVATLWCSRSPS